MTKLLYLDDFSLLTCEAHILDVVKKDEHNVLILDQTVFYPQGGGQPFDQGIIESPKASFNVQEVRFIEDNAWHIGDFTKGTFQIGDAVRCIVDESRRKLNNRVHSAGHVIDAVLENMGLGWVPGRGYHFPEGPFVEYSGDLENLSPIEFQKELELKCNEYAQKNLITRVAFMGQDEMQRTFKFQPKALPEGQKARIIYFGNFGIPCGGTHVPSTEEIGEIIIKKVKQHKDIVRIAYSIK